MNGLNDVVKKFSDVVKTGTSTATINMGLTLPAFNEASTTNTVKDTKLHYELKFYLAVLQEEAEKGFRARMDVVEIAVNKMQTELVKP